MNCFRLFMATLLSLTVSTSFVMGQVDTALTITKTGYVGIGISNPATELHVVGSMQLDKVGPALGRLILKTASFNDPGRYGILFSNNQLAPFLGEDLGTQTYGFYSVWGAERKNDAVVNVYGKAKNSWGNVLSLTHNGTDGIISTDTGNLILSPSYGKGRVGIGTTEPGENLDVVGNAHISGKVTSGVDKVSLPIAYGVIGSDATIHSGTSNFSCIWSADNGRYEITITGESYILWNYITTVTVTGSSPSIVTTESISGKLLVYIHNMQGSKIQKHFHFVTYKPLE